MVFWAVWSGLLDDSRHGLLIRLAAARRQSNSGAAGLGNDAGNPA